MKKTFIKICGLTNPHEAKECAGLGAHALGLVFFKKSPRNLSMEDAENVCTVVPHNIITTGVFVDETYDFIMKRVERCKLKAVQLHGKESPALVTKLADNGVRVIKALFGKKEPLFDKAKLYENAWACLVEYGKGKLPGGNAEKWNWELVKNMVPDRRIIVAGGLGPDNVCSALAMSGAFGVDVSSGVESYPGRKDLEKVRRFIENIMLEEHTDEIF